jgi:hypothetical protein
MSTPKRDVAFGMTLPSLANVSAGFAVFSRSNGQKCLIRKDLVIAVESLKEGGCKLFVSMAFTVVHWDVVQTLPEVSDRLRSIPNNYPGV